MSIQNRKFRPLLSHIGQKKDFSFKILISFEYIAFLDNSFGKITL
jgi:hypothetical protein